MFFVTCALASNFGSLTLCEMGTADANFYMPTIFRFVFHACLSSFIPMDGHLAVLIGSTWKGYMVRLQHLVHFGFAGQLHAVSANPFQETE